MVNQIVTWWCVVQVIGLLALPITTFLFRALPDRGYPFSKALGLLITGYGVWLLAMLGLGSFGVPLIMFVLLVIGAVGLVVQYTARQHATPYTEAPGHAASRSLLARISSALPTMLAYEVLFLVALVAMAWIRSHMPDPWGTERPMDFAFFNAIQRSTTFPPHDPWLAGYSINYYYFGYLLMAVVAMLSGLDPAVAFNLSLALIFALTALGSAGVLANLIRITQAQATHTQQTGVWRQFFSVYSLMSIPLLGAVLVLVVGNQAGVLQVVTGDYRVVALDGGQLVATLQQSFADSETIELPSPVQTVSFGTIEELARSDTVADFNWWWPSRTLWDEAETGVRSYNITEFPFFSFWLGDMHPHVMALPFNLLAVAVALQLLVGTQAGGRGLRSWLELLLTALVLGSLYIINSWDLPTYMLLYSGALLLLFVRSARQASTAIAWRAMGWQLASVVLAAFLLFVPFFLTFRSLVGFAEPLVDLPLLSTITTIIAPYSDSKSGLHSFMIIFGLFVLPLIAFVYGQWTVSSGDPIGRSADTADDVDTTDTADDASNQAPARVWSSVVPWLVPGLLLVGLVLNFSLLALLGLGIAATFQAVRRVEAAPAESFVLLVVALGCAILFGTELIYIRDVFNTRMNTIFKFYYQVWLLWGTMAAYAVWWILRHALGAGQGRVAGYRVAVVLVTTLFVVLLVGGMVYPAINVRNLAAHEREQTLQGKTPREFSVAGAESIRWLREHAHPRSYIIEAVGDSYNGEGYGGVAASTGIPTVLGWPGHERQWRGGDEHVKAEIAPRETDVETIYSTGNAQQALDLLRKYDVEYVYVGALERQKYGDSVEKFGTIGMVVFQQDEVTIYWIPVEHVGL